VVGAEEGVVEGVAGGDLVRGLDDLPEVLEVLLGQCRVGEVEVTVRMLGGPELRLGGSLASARWNQYFSTSDRCRTRPISDMLDGSTLRSTSCSPVSPETFHSSVPRW
jgi:hypothetical protein